MTVQRGMHIIPNNKKTIWWNEMKQLNQQLTFRCCLTSEIVHLWLGICENRATYKTIRHQRRFPVLHYFPWRNFLLGIICTIITSTSTKTSVWFIIEPMKQKLSKLEQQRCCSGTFIYKEEVKQFIFARTTFARNLVSLSTYISSSNIFVIYAFTYVINKFNII